ncbi:DNA repair protein RecN (Recombination protein N) [Chitinivorax tropicus]|uniref:DNA repair protein RecN n=1 Tax=Chitinivorax tropicus TaxID=714531 RepID=A0A840MLW2_9PROT|nr:DNA repair protein RecN [Chitinivorax tropicus]MBB5018475.1 DNA repair protein RecN (Recombination protein N) [Chitinivorax tropicus]
MLLTLRIRDFVIVDKLQLDFKPGFTVLTGETGAGKSILIDALGLVLGERAEPGMVRAGAAKSEIEAEFDIVHLVPLQTWLADNELVGDDHALLMRRTVDSNGRSRAFINGRSVTLQQLKEAGEHLVDIHGQHAHQSLLKADAQRLMVDGYGGLLPLAAEVKAAWQAWQSLRRTRLEWEKNAAAYAAEREQLQWQVKELSALGFTADIWRDLQTEHARLSNAASLLEGAQFGLDLISENEPSAAGVVGSVLSRLQGLAEYDPALCETIELLESAEVQLREVAYGLRHYLQRADLDPQRLQEVESRLDAIHGMARKYRVSEEVLGELLATKQVRLDELGGEDADDGLLKREQAAEAHFRQVAMQLSARRAEVASELGQRVTTEMQQLAMASGRFDITLKPQAEGSAHGLEQIEFLVSANAGMAPRPLAKVASGGELSRISLALQVVASSVASVPVLVFDEVDVGIGGRVAEIVGQLLKRLGAAHQVLCITHLPQVAARGDQQWQVAKHMADGNTLSSIRELSAQERVAEIARMLGGVAITDTTLKHAEEMLAG